MNRKRTWPTFLQKLTKAVAIRPTDSQALGNTGTTSADRLSCKSEKKGPIVAFHFGVLR